MKTIRTTSTLIFTFFVLFLSTSATAQYMWLDAAGRKVFSDQPPPATVSAKNILQRPSKATTSTPASAEKTTAESDADGDKTAAKAIGSKELKDKEQKDKELEAAKKKLDDAAAAKKKEEQEARDAAKADNCVRAKQAKATLDSGMRLSSVNAKGERLVMDEATRMVESKRIEGIIASDCKVN